MRRAEDLGEPETRPGEPQSSQHHQKAKKKKKEKRKKKKEGKKSKKKVASEGTEPATLALLAPRSTN